jgi:conjugal transfer pilus assembly protein TraV
MQNYKLLIKHILGLLFILFLGGCSVLPYEDEYACRISDNYGKCMSIKQSYNGASAPDLAPGENHRLTTKQAKAGKKDSTISMSSRDAYLDRYYEEVAGLIHAPETPVVKPSKTIRTLILSYSGSAQKRTLYMPRFVYSIVEESEFVLTQFYKTPEQDADIFVPGRSQ